MRLKCLIDECLTPALVKIAVAKGHMASTCVRDRGWLGIDDAQLVRRAVANDYTIVTRNCVDFRGPGKSRPSGLLQRETIHAGFIGLDSRLNMTQGRQAYLFEAALNEYDAIGDLTNKALEVREAWDGTLAVDVYDIPAG